MKEKLKVEEAPRPDSRSKRTVRLLKVGAFVRAYDWSAWLLKRYGSPLNEGLDTSDGGTHIFVGFPLASIDKFIPEGCEQLSSEDGIPTEWIFPETKFPPEERYDILDTEYSKWQSETLAGLLTEQQERKERKKAKQAVQRAAEDDTMHMEVSAHPFRLTDIVRQIMRFPIDSRSPQECVDFIRQLKDELLELL